MARPKKATVDYFPHVTEQGATTFILQQRWGNDGYAAWFKILERIGTSDGHYIDCRNVGTWRHLQAYTMVSEQVLTEILDALAELEAIDRGLWAYRVIYCQKFVDGVKDAYRRRLDQIPTRGGVCAVTNVHQKEFLTAETLPEEVYAVRSTEREREREREYTTTERTKTELAFLRVFDEKEKTLRRLFPQHDYEVVKEGILAHWRNLPPPMDPYDPIYKWFQRQQITPTKLYGNNQQGATTHGKQQSKRPLQHGLDDDLTAEFLSHGTG